VENDRTFAEWVDDVYHVEIESLLAKGFLSQMAACALVDKEVFQDVAFAAPLMSHIIDNGDVHVSERRPMRWSVCVDSMGLVVPRRQILTLGSCCQLPNVRTVVVVEPPQELDGFPLGYAYWLIFEF
jgi:hypothetical protein